MARFLADPQGGDWSARCEARVLFGVVRAVIVAYAALTVALWIPGVARRPGLSTLVIAVSAIPMFVALGLAHRGRRVAAGRVTLAALLVGAMVSIACFGGLRGPVVFSLPLSVAAAGLLRGRRAASLAAAAGGAFLVLEAALEGSGVAPFVVATMTPAAGLASVMSGVISALGLITIYTREVESSRREATECTQRALAVEHELANMVRFAPVGMAVLDSNGVVERANEAMAGIAGWSADSLVGKGLADLLGMGSEESRAAVLDGIARLHERGEALWEQRLCGPGGTQVPVEFHARFLRGASGPRRVQLVVRDLSFRVEAEQARDRLEAELREARRLQGLGRLAGGIAHDFRNLITPILADAEMLRERGNLLGVERELAAEIELAAQRASALTSQLLTFARRQHMEMRAIEPRAVIGEIEPLLRRLLGAEVALQLSLARDSGAFSGDRTQFEQVIVNLVANARDAMPRGGVVRIETGNVTILPDEALHGPPRKAGDYVALTVADTGTGMPEEVRRHVFEPFFTTKGHDRGTGLGLATVYGIVAQCGGTIEVESTVGHGTVFRILLPRVAGAAEPAEDSPQAPAAPRRQGRILVVDDEDLMRSSVARMLRSAGHRVTEASDGVDALGIAGREPVPFDLLVTDVVMPRMSGTELAGRLRGANGGPRVIFMSGFGDDAAAAEQAGSPGVAFLAKPFPREALLARVEALLAAHEGAA